MKQQPASDLSFNALTDAWLPLLHAGGTTTWASPVDVLTGVADAPDLDYPRDDFRVYARLLLSALVQALFAAADRGALSKRLQTSMARAEVERRIQPVLSDFDLFGPTPFLQVVPTVEMQEKDKGAAPFVFPNEDLFEAPTTVEAVSLPIAVVMLFAEQAYAGGAGRGYGAGPGGQPGALTLIDAGSVRTTAWANTLTLDLVKARYAADGQQPWSNAKRKPKPRAATGLIEGLFFQSRSVWLEPAGTGTCSFSGRAGPLVRRSVLLPKSELTKKTSGKEDLWQHPCAPLAVNSQGIGAVRLKSEQPAWTGLAQLLDPVSKGKQKKQHPAEGPALVLQQWKSLPAKSKRPRLVVLDFDRDKAIIRRRFFEAFPLTEQLIYKPATLERLRALTTAAQDVQRALGHALSKAHDARKQGATALADAISRFWSTSEGPFFDWLACITERGADDDGSEQRLDTAREEMMATLRTTALTIFDAHVSVSEFDPRKQALVAMARKDLRFALYPKPAEKAHGHDPRSARNS